MNSFSLEKKHKSLGARTMHLIIRQLKHWLPSKMSALNYSVTHHIRHSSSYCTANGWLEDQEQQFSYNGITALEKCWTRCILVAGYKVKSDKIWSPYLIVNCVSLRTFWMPLVIPLSSVPSSEADRFKEVVRYDHKMKIKMARELCYGCWWPEFLPSYLVGVQWWWIQKKTTSAKKNWLDTIKHDLLDISA